MNSLKRLFFLTFAVCSIHSWSQENNQEIELTIENDKFLFVDRYYTSGLFIKYKKRLSEDFIFKKNENTNLQFNVTLGNETYTPTDLSSDDPNRFDRPFAGWLYGNAEIGHIRNNAALFLAFEAGITGKESFAGTLQLAAHDFLGIDDAPTWEQEIPFKILFNLKATYIYNLQLGKKSALLFETQPTIGTKDIFFRNSASFFFGNTNSLTNSSKIGAVDNSLTNEFFGYIGFGNKLVLHNTILQGGITANETTFTASPTRSIFSLQIGTVLKMRKSTFKFGYFFNTKETASSTSHGYGSLSFARNF